MTGEEETVRTEDVDTTRIRDRAREILNGRQRTESGD